MKKIVTATALLIATACGDLTAQSQLPNPGFENWSVAANGTDSADGWSSSNAVVISPVRSLYESTDAYAGSRAAHVVTAPFGFVQYSTLGILANGRAQFSYGGGGNNVNVSYISGGGTPINYKPAALNGYYKYSVLQPDRGLGCILLSRYNALKGARDTISYSVFQFTPQTAYTAFTIQLNDLMPGVVPDSVTCLFYSSDPVSLQPYSAWSDLYLDSLHLLPEIPTGMELPKVKQAFRVAPNPSAGQFTITALAKDVNHLDVYDAGGRLIRRVPLADAKEIVKVDLGDIVSGAYLLVPGNREYPAQRILIHR
jgi:hypothetical protein